MSTGRPKEFDPQHVLNAAMHAFWSKGYEATTLQDLLKVTELSKSSLYQAFGGKQQLFGQCMSAYTDRMVEHLRGKLDASHSALGFIQSTLVEIASEASGVATPRGCLIMNTASEFGQRDPTFSAWVDLGLTRIRTVFELALKRAQAEGELTRSQSASSLADFLMTNIAGLRTMVKAGTPTKSMLGVVETVMGSLQGNRSRHV